MLLPLVVLRELWDSRELTREFVKRDLTIRYAQAVMGVAWAVLLPLLIIASGLVFRLVVANIAGTPITSADIGAITVKALPWAFFSGAISMSTQTLVAHANLIGKVYFPRESLPLSTIIAQAVDSGIGAVASLVVLLALGMTPGGQALWFLPMMLLLGVFTFGFALLLSCANLFFRDVKYLVQVVLNFGIFATPVLVEPQSLGYAGARVMLALPLSPYIQALEIAVVRNESLLSTVTAETSRGTVVLWSPYMLAYAVATATAALVVGLLVFRSGASRFAEVA